MSGKTLEDLQAEMRKKNAKKKTKQKAENQRRKEKKQDRAALKRLGAKFGNIKPPRMKRASGTKKNQSLEDIDTFGLRGFNPHKKI